MNSLREPIEDLVIVLSQMRPDLPVEVQQIIDPLLLMAGEVIQRLVEMGL